LVALGQGQAAVVMPHYPHMMSEDTEVWTRFLKEGEWTIEKVWYDVHVGKQIGFADRMDPLVSSIASGISRKRIDVVVKLAKQLWVVEIKPFASYVSLGQVRMYHRLFCEEFQPDIECVPVVICGACDLDVLSDYQNQGIVVFEV